MNFHYFLPSNSSTETFPKNNAFPYSIPVTNIDKLDSEWEVGIMSFACSNCINTFNYDIITLEESYDLTKILKKTSKPCQSVSFSTKNENSA